MCPAAVRRRKQCPCEIAVVVVILDVISRCKIVNSLANDEYPQSRAAPKRIRLTTSPTKHTPSGPLNLRGQVIDHNKMKSALFLCFFFVVVVVKNALTLRGLCMKRNLFFAEQKRQEKKTCFLKQLEKGFPKKISGPSSDRFRRPSRTSAPSTP